jgi:hypothetical protein
MAKPAKKKRKLSAAGKAAIVAALRKRWAAKRAEAAKAKQAAGYESSRLLWSCWVAECAGPRLPMIASLRVEHSRSQVPVRLSGQSRDVSSNSSRCPKVTVRIGRGFDMTKGPDGIWSVTTTPLVVGFHYYTLQIDGATSRIRRP